HAPLPAAIYTLSLHDALPILDLLAQLDNRPAFARLNQPGLHILAEADALVPAAAAPQLRELNPRQQIELLPQTAHALHWSQPLQDRKSTRLNSSHVKISYAVF